MLNVIAAIAGAGVLVLVWSSVLRTTVIPRRSSSRLARWTGSGCAVLGRTIARRLPAGAGESVMMFAVPVGLFLMAAGWLFGLVLGAVLLAAGVRGRAADLASLTAFPFDGNAPLLLLGVLTVGSAALILGAFVAYLVCFMDAYNRRERMITRSSTQVHLVTDADQLLVAYLRSGSRDRLDSYFAEWAGWFADVHDSHLSYPGLIYHRSAGELCWAKVALIVLDIAALVEAVAPRWAPLHTGVLLDSGSACLQRLARRVGVRLPATEVSLHGREERSFGDTVRLATESGLPAESNIDQASRAFQDRRVRYAPHAVQLTSQLLNPWRFDDAD